MTRGTGRAHIARAALEAIALQTADVFLAMSADSGLPLTELRVDGGASRNNLLMQMQANVLGVPVVRSQVTETTALGAAYLAGLATDYWTGADEIAAQWQGSVVLCQSGGWFAGRTCMRDGVKLWSDPANGRFEGPIEIRAGRSPVDGMEKLRGAPCF